MLQEPFPLLEARQESDFERLLDAMPDAVIVSRVDGQIALVNRQAEVLFGYLREELLGQPVEMLLPERFRGGHVQHRRTYAEAPRVRPMGSGFDLFGLRKDGGEVPVEISLSPFTMHGEMAVISTVRDVSGRKAIESRLRLQSNLIELARDAILVRDLDSRILEWNSGAEALYGWAAAEVRGEVTHTLLKTHFPESLAELERRLPHDGEWEGELWHNTRDGREVVVESRQVLVRDSAGQPIAVLEVNRDVTARRQAEAERTSLLTQLGAIQHVTDTALSRLALDDLLPDLLARIRLALSADTAVVLLVDDADQSLVARAALGLEEEVEQQVRVPLGQGFAGRIAAERHALAVDDVSAIETVNPLLKAKGVRSLLGVPLLVEDRLLGVLHVGTMHPRQFIAEEIRLLQLVADRAALALDRARVYEEARQAVRVRNEFLSTLSHDLGNPVAAIRIESRQLLEATQRGEEPDLLEGLAQIELAATRMWRQVEEILDLARLQVGRTLDLNWGTVDLSELTRELVGAQQAMTGRHELILQLEAADIVGEWDRSRLERVISNLLSNAVKYSPDGGEIVVRLRREMDPSGRPLAVLVVRDGGIGIPAADLPHIFERFHRAGNTRGQFPGTGIGLHGAQRIVALHGGELQIQSEQHAGTTVTVRLPLD